MHHNEGRLLSWKGVVGMAIAKPRPGLGLFAEYSLSRNYGDVLMSGLDVPNFNVSSFSLKVHL